MNEHWGRDEDATAQGRIKGGPPVAVLDIGSNSVRLVVYERHARALTPLYNEKTSAALGRGIASGRLADDNMSRALTAIRRFALVAKQMGVGQVYILATSAVRDAANREEFVSAVQNMMGYPVRVLSGAEEAHFAALGVISGIPRFSGIVGDLGGGSLELSHIDDGQDAQGETHPLGVIRLQDDSGGSPSKAASIVRARLRDSSFGRGHPSGVFCAIGGTWRSLAKIHQVQRGYPLHMVQHYQVKAPDFLKMCEDILDAGSTKHYPGSDSVSSSRRELVPYGAAVLSEVIQSGNYGRIVFSALGVREGYLYELLPEAEKQLDPLIESASEVSVLRSRSPAHAADLIEFTARFISGAGLTESAEERRLREVACLLSDIGWRGHPDYRGKQSVDHVAYSSMVGVDHPGRAFLAEVLAVRYMGLKHKSESQALLSLAGADLSARARIMGAAMRVAYPMSAAMPGVLPRISFRVSDNTLVLVLPESLLFLNGEHLRGRLEQLAGVSGFNGSMVVIE